MSLLLTPNDNEDDGDNTRKPLHTFPQDSVVNLRENHVKQSGASSPKHAYTISQLGQRLHTSEKLEYAPITVDLNTLRQLGFPVVCT